MKSFMVLPALMALGALGASQTTKPADDARCSQVRFQSARTLPTYNGPGFGTVEYSGPDEPFIVPAGCFQFFCSQKGETYRILSCPNLKMRSFARNQSPTSAVNSVPSNYQQTDTQDAATRERSPQ